MKINEVTSVRNSTQVNEAFPLLIPALIAGVRIAAPWAIKQGARIIAKRSVAANVAKKGAEVVAKGTGTVAKGAANTLLKRPIATTTIGGGAYVAKKTGDGIDELIKRAGEGIDAVKDELMAALGSAGFAKVAKFTTKYGIPVLAAVAILYGGKKVWDYLSKSSKEQPKLATESQKDTHCSDKCCGADTKREDCVCPADCKHCNCNDPSVAESATAGGTSAGSVASVVNPTYAYAKGKKKGKNGLPKAPQATNPDGTAKNALDVKNNLMGGKVAKR